MPNRFTSKFLKIVSVGFDFVFPVNTQSFESRETSLMSLAFLFHYLMLNMFQMLIHPSSGACDLFVELFRGLYCSVRIEVCALAYLFSG
jgi:hypothetical protein